MYTDIDDELAAQLSRRLPRPFGPGDDAEGNLGTGGGQDQSANPVGDGATPLTLQDIDRLLNERLAPVQRAMDDTRNHREQVNRRLGLGKYKGQQEVDEGAEDRNQDGKQLTGAEKRAAAAEKRLAAIEQKAAAATIKSTIADGLDSLDQATLAPGARGIIERLIRQGAVLDPDSGRVYFDDGETQVPIEEAIQTESNSPMFRKASSRQGGGGKAGEATASQAQGPSEFEELTEEEVAGMTDADFAKLRAKHQKLWNRGRVR